MTDASQNATSPKSLSPFQARARFFAHKDEIAARLAQAHSMREVWKHLRDERGVRLSYGAFRFNVVKYLPDARVTEPTPKAASQPTAQPQNPQPLKDEGDGLRAQRPRERRFHYDPANARREDLV